MTTAHSSDDHGRVSPVRLLTLTYQLALVLLLAHRFMIEEGFGFVRILALIFVGFVTNAIAPPRFRRQLFVGLSLASILIVMPFPHSLAVIGGGLGLIGVCHLPLPLRIRVALLVLIGGCMAAVRGGVVGYGEWRELPSLILPMLGAMFMFRLAVYLYDSQHDTKPASIWERLGYFFMLPNVCFLLFPVVDYKTYRRTYYDKPAEEIYQKGLSWMLRGVVQIVLYRLVYQYFVPAPGEIHGIFGVAVASLTLFALYLRVSGTFHLIVGVLCIFGFNLPATHNRYYLAESVNDFWRRINIYWKDFMMKLVYLPVYMRFRKSGESAAMIYATIIVFMVTWALHSYQWFWIRGEFPIHAADGVFWSILGILVIFNSLSEAKSSRGRPLTKPVWDPRAAFSRSCRIAATFSFMTILWTLWNSTSLQDGIGMLAKAAESPPWHFAVFALAVAACVGVGVLVQFLNHNETFGSRPLAVRAPTTYTTVIAGALLLVTVPEGLDRIDDGAAEVVATLRRDKLNVKDRELAARGHYEGLKDAGKFTSALWTGHVGKPKGVEWKAFEESNVVMETDDELEVTLKPSFDGSWKDAAFQTNEWGMRDKPYEKAKPPGTFRIALVGASYEVGAGVPNDATAEAVLEERLNREHGGEEHERYEILNFGVGGYSLVRRKLVIEDRVGAFDPDLVMLMAYPMQKNRSRLFHDIAGLLKRDKLVDPFLLDVVQRSGATADMSMDDIRARLSPHTERIVTWCFRRARIKCEELGSKLVTVFLPTTEPPTPYDRSILSNWWECGVESGISALRLDAEDVYGDRERAPLQLAPWDTHPNSDGHRLVADALYRLILENDEMFGLDLAPRK